MAREQGYRSCVGYLNELRKGFGITKKEYRDAAKTICRPTEVKLPVFYDDPIVTPESVVCDTIAKVKVKKSRRKYRTVYWYLEEYLRKRFSKEIYKHYESNGIPFETMVDELYKVAMETLAYLNREPLREISEAEMFEHLSPPPPPPLPYEIPDRLWDKFCEFCKDHPIKNASQIIPRREKFLNKVRKRDKRLYKSKNLMLYDPLFAQVEINELEMIQNLERIAEDNERRCSKFMKMLEGLEIKDRSIGSVAMAAFNKHTANITKRSREHIQELIGKVGRPEPITTLPIKEYDYETGEFVISMG